MTDIGSAATRNLTPGTGSRSSQQVLWRHLGALVAVLVLGACGADDDGLPVGTKVPMHYIGEFTATADSTSSHRNSR